MNTIRCSQSILRRPGLTAMGCILALSACGSPRTDPVWVADLGYTRHEVYHIRMDEHGLPVTRVFIGGLDLEMIFDTGNMSGLALSAAGALQLDLPVVRETNQRNSEGEVIGTSPVYRVDSMYVFGKSWKAQEAVASGIDYGLLGPRYYSAGRFTIDYHTDLVAISARSAGLDSLKGTLLRLVSAERFPGLIVVRGLINGRPVLLEIDTGKTRSVVDPEFARAIGLTAAENGFRIDSLRLGDLVFSVPSAKAVGYAGISRHLPEPIRAGVGSDILSQVVMTVDYPAGEVLLARHWVRP